MNVNTTVVKLAILAALEFIVLRYDHSKVLEALLDELQTALK
jgi:hypothetical protein|tara:strand:- start:222 stop:347 length:126 start_codon:yes stop_codon:yes gene_type:complete